MPAHRTLVTAGLVALTLAALGPLSACMRVDQTQMSGATGDGRIAFAWTIQGAAASAATCAGVDHLWLSLTYYDGSEVTISPIPCTAGRLRYDNLPIGVVTLVLDAIDDSGCRALEGSAPVTISTVLPDPPSPTIDLAPASCH